MFQSFFGSLHFSLISITSILIFTRSKIVQFMEKMAELFPVDLS